MGTRKERNRSFLNKDYEAFRFDLLNYAKTYYGDKIRGFSESSMGGIFMDLAAYVGDVMSYYLDYQFNELDPNTAIEDANIERLIRAAGVPITGATPSVVDVAFTITVPADTTTNQPNVTTLPIIAEGTLVTSESGIIFELVEELDFNLRDAKNNFVAVVDIANSSSGVPTEYNMTMTGLCVSGEKIIEEFTISDDYEEFRQITLTSDDISDIISVRDSDNNIWYEVASLTHDTVFEAIDNINSDGDVVNDVLVLRSAPRRFIKETSALTGITTLTFGAGDSSTLDNDIVPDLSEYAVPLYGKTTFTKFALDPGEMLRTRTLGLSPQDTTLTVTYRAGGGLSHNIPAETIVAPEELNISFPLNPTVAQIVDVRSSLVLNNLEDAAGGEEALSLNELRLQVRSARNAQSRIVTREDMLARVYTMPSNFGRVFRAGIGNDSANPLATRMYIISRNEDEQLVFSPDTLKDNLAKYLNQFRLISDAIDILDARVINVAVEFKITVSANAPNKSIVLQDCIRNLQEFFVREGLQVGKPITIGDINNVIFTTEDVVSVVDLQVINRSGTYQNRDYSNVVFDVTSNTIKKIIVPPEGGIFELKYPDFDIVGSVV